MRASIIVLFLLAISQVKASRILFLFPTPSKSHMIIAHALSTALAEKGHDVTVFSPFPLSKKLKNHREFATPISKEIKSEMNKFVSGKTSILKSIFTFPRIMVQLSEDMVNTDDFKSILNEEFDLVIISVITNDFLLGYGDYFKCPTASLGIQRHSSYSNINIANPVEINAINHAFFMSDDLAFFFSRVKNFVVFALEKLIFALIIHPIERSQYNKMFPADRYRSFEESMKNVSLVLVNDHFSEGTVRPNVPAIIEVRGLQVKPVPDELSEDIKNFFDGATDGVIYFSLGTNVDPETLPKERIEMFMAAFGKLKQRVIMKWDVETIEGKPDNVMLRKWLPQDDILAHPKVKLFISHCGLGGVVESKYHGVPILGLPIFGDQEMNCKDIIREGWALRLDIQTLAQNELLEAIDQLVYNETYSSRIKKISQISRDRPMSPRETAVYWIEYVIRHHGAPHMQYRAVHQNFWQRTSLDVIAFLAICVIISLKIFKIIFSKITKKLFLRKKTENNKKTN